MEIIKKDKQREQSRRMKKAIERLGT